MSNMNSTMTMTNKMVHEIDVLFNMIKEQQYQMNLMKNQLESQSELISSLQKQVEFITPKGRPQVDIQAEVDMLLSDEYWSDSKTSNGISTESIDESKKEERKSSFRPSSPHPILNKGPVRILNYSEKAFVVIGDTKKHITTMNKMGGKWNISLTYKETGAKFMGWVFSNRQRDKVSMWIDLGCL